jgi:hypothetical protein
VRILVGLAVCAVLVSAKAYAQDADWDQPERGTGVLRGRVVTTDGRPIPRVLVPFVTEGNSWGQLIADEHGGFEFIGLPAGQYRLYAIKAGHLSRAYGQSTLSDAPVTFALKEGDVRSGMDIALPAGAAIVVRVTDASGVPVEGALVRTKQAMTSASGEVFLRDTMPAVGQNQGTDDRGVVRIYDLEPGNHYVWARPGFLAGQPIDQAAETRHFQGQTFFPGVVRLDDAEPVALSVGQEVSVDVPLAEPFRVAPAAADRVLPTSSRGGAITVHVTDDVGDPLAGVAVRALAFAREGDSSTLIPAVHAVSYPGRWDERRDFFTDDDGNARLYGIAAGSYVVVAEPPLGRIVDRDRRNRTLTYVPTYFPGSPSRAGAHVLSIQPWDDVQLEVRLVPSRAPQIAGRVVRWNGDPSHASVLLRRNLEVGVYPPGLIHDSWIRARVIDGEFRFENVLPGDYIIRTSHDPDSDVRDGVSELAITVEGQDLSDLLLTTLPPAGVRARSVQWRCELRRTATVFERPYCRK